MCGISGMLAFEKKEQEEIERAIDRMDESQTLRGPDDRGVFLFLNGGFGHRRLSIIDLSKNGHQPMIWQRTNSSSQLAITFNGEIYNFQELKKELENSGISFHTNSDTEVILAGYEKWGIDMVKKLRGMFAFGLWDEERQKLFLVRDRYGIKPLYYYFDKEKVVFASTVKAIEKSGEINIEKNNEASIGFLLFGSVPLPHTTLKNVYAVPASHFIEIDVSGNKNVVRYYNPLDFFYPHQSADIRIDQRPEIVQKIRTLLEDSTRGHLISDAPIGVFLSGGLDSSAISALAQFERNNPITTVSVHFEEEEFSEKRYQDMVAKKIGSVHREILITKEGFYKTLDEFWKSMDQPSIDGINSYMISEAARQAGLTVVLSGLGSDEIFLGYTNFRKAKFIRKIQKLPKVVKFPSLFWGSILGGKYRKLSYLRSESILEFYLSFRGIFLPSEVARILNIPIKEVYKFISRLEEEILNTKYDILNTLHPADLLSYLDLTFYMQNQLLKDTDVMSMAHSIEVRVPFLDHPLVEYISSLPAELKLSGGHQKQFLIDATKDIIPSEVWDRPKMGFTFPLQKWLTGRLLVTDYIHSGHFPQGDTLPVAKLHWSQNWAIEVLRKRYEN